METCKVCHDPLVVEIELEEDDKAGDEAVDETQTVPDDLRLLCGCHFHWQCFLDQSPSVSLNLHCPSCDSYLPVNASGPSTTNPFLATPNTSQTTRIPAFYTSENGTQPDVDLLPLITEEAFISAHPEARPARALHILCAAGDVEGIVELWRDVAEGDGSDGVVAPTAAMTVPKLLRWQDPLSGFRSALHVAVAEDQEEVAWLLLWCGSALETIIFPTAAVEAAKELELADRPLISAQEDDIRSIRDEAGHTAGDLAALKPSDSIWARMIAAGILHVS